MTLRLSRGFDLSQPGGEGLGKCHLHPPEQPLPVCPGWFYLPRRLQIPSTTLDETAVSLG